MEKWWIVLLPAEEPSNAEALGPYRTWDRADHFANQWRIDHPDEVRSGDSPIVLPVGQYR